MNHNDAILDLEDLRKTFSEHMEKEKSPFGKHHYQTSIDAIDTALAALRAISPGEPLTQSDLDEMDYEKIWIDYGSGNGGEWALVNNGRIYLLANLEGCAFDDILQAEAPWDSLDRPTGNYTAYRCPPTHIYRDAWEPCELCEKQRKVFNEDFCGNCGRPLTESAWVALKKRILGVRI